MNAFRGTMTATALVFVLSLAAARADPYDGTDDDGNLQLRSAQGQGVFANTVDLVHVRLITLFEATPRGSGPVQAAVAPPTYPVRPQTLPCQRPVTLWQQWQDVMPPPPPTSIPDTL